MNEARDSDQKAKLAIAYAYVNFHKGKVELPKTKWEISYFYVGTEGRFEKQKDDENRERYIGQIVNSLNAADARLADLANKSDPTSGATHWFSQKPIGETKVSPLPSWATDPGVTKIVVPGVDPIRFTFFKGVK
jgi:hypothetical protein